MAEAIARRRAQLNAEVAKKKPGAGTEPPESEEDPASVESKAPSAPEKPGRALSEGAAPPAVNTTAPKPSPTPAAAAPTAAALQAPPTAAQPVAVRQPLTQIMLLVNTFLIAAVGGILVYVVTRKTDHTPSVAADAIKAVRAVGSESPSPGGPDPGPAEPNQPAPAPQGTVATVMAPSWASAETAFAKRDYDQALERFSQLLLASRRVPAEAAAGEFFQYRIGQCFWQLGRVKQAREVLGRLQQSESAPIRAAANADLAHMDERAGQCLRTRTLACRALAALKAMEEVFDLEADCDYLMARALTEQVRSYHTSERRVPWSRQRTSDVFARRDEAGIRRLLDRQIASPGPARRGPTIEIERTAQGWRLAVHQAAVEDVVHQLASKAGRDVRWASVPPAVRRRLVSLHLLDVSEQRAFELTCGAAALLARFTWEQVVVHDPQSVASLVERKKLLGEAAVSAWRRFALRHSEDPRVPEGQFALAVLYEYADDVVAAMKQYQLVGRQYQDELRLAPQALIRSAELRIPGLRDFAGARADLQDVLDRYSGYAQVDRVYLLLGRFSMQAGQLDEAVKALRRLEDLDVSDTSRGAAYLELGDCHYRRGEYAEASRHLSKYLTGTEEHVGKSVVRAYLLLGRSEAAQAHRAAAAAAFRRALSARPLQDDYVEAILSLTEAQTEAEDYVGAMATIRRIENEELADAQRYRYLRTVATLYRSMGLPDRARAFLRQGGGSVRDRDLQARLAAEQARCLAEEGDLRGARDTLSEVLGRLNGGAAAREVSLDLAGICMRLLDYEQAIVLAREALRGACPAPARRRALKILGRAYLKTGKFRQAAEALTNLAPRPEGKVEAPRIAAAGKEAS